MMPREKCRSKTDKNRSYSKNLYWQGDSCLGGITKGAMRQLPERILTKRVPRALLQFRELPQQPPRNQAPARIAARSSSSTLTTSTKGSYSLRRMESVSMGTYPL